MNEDIKNLLADCFDENGKLKPDREREA